MWSIYKTNKSKFLFINWVIKNFRLKNEDYNESVLEEIIKNINQELKNLHI